MKDDPHHHAHSHGTEQVGDGILLWTIIINLGLSIFEFGAGIIAGSIALMADALHNTNDAAALLIAFIARKISKKRADQNFTFGYRRAELIGAMIQLTALIMVGLYLVYEAVRRFFQPEEILGGWVMAAASVALVVDGVTAWLLWAMSKGSMNVKAAFLHNLTDAGASIAVLLGGAAIYWLNWTWVDPVITLLIAGYILYMSYGLLKSTSRMLMEGAPPGLSLAEVVKVMKSVGGVTDIHHLHIWEIDEQHRALEAHIVISEEPVKFRSIRRQLKQALQEQFKIDKSNLQASQGREHARCTPGV